MPRCGRNSPMTSADQPDACRRRQTSPPKSRLNNLGSDLTALWRSLFASGRMSSANHLSLIRSFLIDSRPTTASRGEFYAKYFCAVHELKLLAKNERQARHVHSICLAAAIDAENGANEKSLFHRIICNTGNSAPRLSFNGAHSVAACNSHRPLTISEAVLVSLTHTM